MNVYGIIMAGGDGTRLWPLSRKKTPKQLLNLSGKGALVNETIARLQPAVTRDVFIVTSRAQAENLKETVGNRVPDERVFLEPCARNTAACVGYAAVKILKEFGDGVMVIVPSDSYIKDGEAYARTLNTAVQYAERTDKLVTIGITPTFPATGYGYIRVEDSNELAKPILRFVEKPAYEQAVEYLKQGGYVWNSGVFVWKVSVILQQYKKLLPDVYEALMQIYEAAGTERETQALNEVYGQIRAISVDVGILERTRDILVVSGEFGWNDVGSLDMIAALHERDESGNVVIGDVLQMQSKNNIIYAQNKLVVTLGLEDTIVIETPDVTFVCPKERAQEVKQIVEEIKRGGKEEVL